MATPPKSTTSERPRRLRTNLVIGEAADGAQSCLYVGTSADEALRMYALLRERNGKLSAAAPQLTRAVLILDPRTSKHCSF